MNKDRGLALVVLAGLTGVLYQLQEILQQHSTWTDFRTPAGVGEIIFAVFCGLVAVGAALGIDLPSLAQSFRKKE